MRTSNDRPTRSVVRRGLFTALAIAGIASASTGLATSAEAAAGTPCGTTEACCQHQGCPDVLDRRSGQIYVSPSVHGNGPF